MELQTAPSTRLSVSFGRFFCSSLGSFLYPTQSAGLGHHCVLREMQNAFLVQPKNLALRNKMKSPKTTDSLCLTCSSSVCNSSLWTGLSEASHVVGVVTASSFRCVFSHILGHRQVGALDSSQFLVFSLKGLYDTHTLQLGRKLLPNFHSYSMAYLCFFPSPARCR